MSAVSIRHAIEYLAVRVALCQLLELPVAASLRTAERAGALAYHVLKGRTRVGRDNIAAAFPELSDGEVRCLLKEVYRNLFRTVAEIFYLRRVLRASNWRELVEFENVEAAFEVVLAGRGGILVTGHLGNWELLAQILSLVGIGSRAMARPLDNPLLDRYILGVRESGLQRIVLKRGSGALVEKTLVEGGLVSLLVDQDAGRKGVFVPFFGRPASTWRSTALLSQKTGAPILPGCCVRTGRGFRFKVIVGSPIYPNDSADVSTETLRITCDFTGQVEGWVRRFPEQYLWLHRRWKTAPGPRSLVGGGCA